MKNVHQTSSPLYVSTIRLNRRVFENWWLGRGGKKIGGWVEVDWWLQRFISVIPPHYMYLVHQNKLMTFCGFGMKTTSFGPPSCRLESALKKHNLCMHAIAPHHCLSPPTPHCPVPTFRFGRFFS